MKKLGASGYLEKSENRFIRSPKLRHDSGSTTDAESLNCVRVETSSVPTGSVNLPDTELRNLYFISDSEPNRLGAAIGGGATRAFTRVNGP